MIDFTHPNDTERTGDRIMHNQRSAIITQGTNRTPNRSMLRAVGFTDDDFSKPIVGVANGFSTITPCNLGLNTLTAAAEAGIREAGGMPQSFGTITHRPPPPPRWRRRRRSRSRRDR